MDEQAPKKMKRRRRSKTTQNEGIVSYGNDDNAAETANAAEEVQKEADKNVVLTDEAHKTRAKIAHLPPEFYDSHSDLLRFAWGP